MKNNVTELELEAWIFYIYVLSALYYMPPVCGVLKALTCPHSLKSSFFLIYNLSAPHWQTQRAYTATTILDFNARNSSGRWLMHANKERQRAPVPSGGYIVKSFSLAASFTTLQKLFRPLYLHFYWNALLTTNAVSCLFNETVQTVRGKKKPEVSKSPEEGREAHALDFMIEVGKCSTNIRCT